MIDGMRGENIVNSETFSATTLFYARLRRVTGRVIDALYLAENKEYACYAIEIAQQANDPELERLTQRLYALLDLSAAAEPAAETQEEQLQGEEPEYREEATPEEIYNAQVSHHYIGALR
jgi:hypothetical protein